jgi:serine/threonine-protein kinase
MEELDDCVIEEVLGHGGMSVVYRGHDAQGQPVAIKVLNVTDDYIVRKFVQEQQIGEILGQHPYIRSVSRLGRTPQGNLFLVMEYVDGCSLRRLVGQLSESDIVRIIGQCCAALAYAHDMHVVHRDIKPENILIDREGAVKLTDFGIAKLTSSVSLTTDRIVGTPEYLSPEQARGDQRVGPASDVYSMGIVLYELLTGQVPFPLPRGESSFQAAVTVLRQHISTPPPSIRERSPDTPQRLEKVALRALDKSPKKRYRTAAAMGKALGYEGEPVVVSEQPGPGVPIGLVVVRGARSGNQIILTGDDVTIGRADLDPVDASISRRHAILSVRGNQLWIEDISLNGTHVNGERIFGEAPLQAGDRVEIADCLLTPLAAPAVEA